MKFGKLTIAVLICAALLFIYTPAIADEYVLEVPEAVITVDQNRSGYGDAFSNDIVVNETTISATFRFNDDLVDSNASPNIGEYYVNGGEDGIYSVAEILGRVYESAESTRYRSYVKVWDNYYADYDRINILAQIPNPYNSQEAYIRLNLKGIFDFISDDSLSFSEIDFSNFTSGTLQILYFNPYHDMGAEVESTVNSFTIDQGGEPEPDLDRGLVAYYPLDGNAYDAGNNALHGTESGNLIYTEGKQGQAAVFDGSTSRITVLDDPLFNFGTNDFALSLWMKSNNSSNNKIAGKDAAYTPGTNAFSGYFLQHASGKINFCTRNLFGSSGEQNCMYSNSSVNIDEWTHIIAIRESNMLSLYINGILDRTMAESAPTDVSSVVDFLIGDFDQGSDFMFRGALDDLRIYNRALNSAEIQLLYSGDNNECNLIDSDRDGVIDQWDSCSDTPPTSYVDSVGCALTGYYTQAELDAAVEAAEAAKDQIIADKDTEITNLNQIINSLNQTITALETELADKDQIIADLNAIIVQKDQIIGDLNALIAEKEQAIADLNATIDDLNATIAQNEQFINNLNAVIAEKEDEIASLNATIENLNIVISTMFTQEEVDQAIADACPGNSDNHGRPDNPGNSNPPGQNKKK